MTVYSTVVVKLTQRRGASGATAFQPRSHHLLMMWEKTSRVDRLEFLVYAIGVNQDKTPARSRCLSVTFSKNISTISNNFKFDVCPAHTGLWDRSSRERWVRFPNLASEQKIASNPR